MENSIFVCIFDFMDNFRCHKLIDCSLCPHTGSEVFTRLTMPKGFVHPRVKQKRNIILFLLEGSLWVDSREYPDTVLRKDQFILQSVGSEWEYRMLEPTDAILYQFDELSNVCDERFRKLADLPDPPLRHEPMEMCPPMRLFIEGMRFYIDSELACSKFIEAKKKEFIFILQGYYPLRTLKLFYHPLLAYENSFRYFVEQNYLKVKTVEEFARLGNYSVASFRRLFKTVFNESAYQWILKRKCTHILQDLNDRHLSISEIAYRYGFEDLSHFSHFCKASFGKSPRMLRAEAEQRTRAGLPDSDYPAIDFPDDAGNVASLY